MSQRKSNFDFLITTPRVSLPRSSSILTHMQVLLISELSFALYLAPFHPVASLLANYRCIVLRILRADSSWPE